ncbi:MAG: hypothetical protein M1409_05965 [Actinobacteria bacterium]|nr:hypothetical protein [Actinomycetota bacterium]
MTEEKRKEMLAKYGAKLIVDFRKELLNPISDERAVQLQEISTELIKYLNPLIEPYIDSAINILREINSNIFKDTLNIDGIKPDSIEVLGYMEEPIKKEINKKKIPGEYIDALILYIAGSWYKNTALNNKNDIRK